ncbi:MAG TPA: radical SAM protein [Planctomycetota bacterium]|nr:radical SAM protein [Planctomycetota bacterium]
MSTASSHHHENPNTPHLIAWEVTRSCMLACKHCRAAARSTPYEGELTTGECLALLDNIASFAKPIIILTGGEPMLRPDIYDIASHARDLGFSVALAPCGMLLNDQTATRILQAGIRRISISIDGATAASHDSFRGVPGAFDAAINGIAAAKRAGLDFQVNTTICRHNLGEMSDILDLAVTLGASVFNPFLLVPTGRGKDLADQEISPQEYERTLRWLARQERPDIRVRVTCAPHYQRIVREVSASSGRHQHGRGCMGGKSFAFISHRGIVQICGFLDVECGDVRRENLDFRKIWETSDVFLRLRDVHSYRGRCGRCEYHRVCGGCRARAHALTGDYLAEEPFCVYQPRRKSAPDGHGRNRNRRNRGQAPFFAGCLNDARVLPLAEKRCLSPISLDEADERILSVVQTALPVDEQPYDVLAQQLGMTEDDVMARLARLRSGGVVRRLGPVFESRRLGYASTLVAARIPEHRLADVAEEVNRIPGVTHNYRRENHYNLWFTLTAPSDGEIERILEGLRQRTGIAEFFSLPAITVYKIRVNFPMGSGRPCLSVGADGVRPDEGTDRVPLRVADDGVRPDKGTHRVPLREADRNLVRLLQRDLPITRRPFDRVAGELGRSPREVVEQIRHWCTAGLIRRFGAVMNHRQLGFTANAMCVFGVPPDRIDTIGHRLAEHPEVSHCYRRPPLPDWSYNLFAMIHGQSCEEVTALAERMAREQHIADYAVLFSTNEFKKTSMEYFAEKD